MRTEADTEEAHYTSYSNQMSISFRSNKTELIQMRKQTELGIGPTIVLKIRLPAHSKVFNNFNAHGVSRPNDGFA